MLSLLVLFADPAQACEGGCPMPTTTAALPAEGTHVTLTVSGMTCGGCASNIQTALLKVEGVKGAVVDHEKGTAAIAYDDKKTDPAKLVAAINALGKYSATAPKS